MPLQFTSVLRSRLTPELEKRIEGAYAQFPELKPRRVRVGLTHKRWLDGLYLDEPEAWDDPYRFFCW